MLTISSKRAAAMDTGNFHLGFVVYSVSSDNEFNNGSTRTYRRSALSVVCVVFFLEDFRLKPGFFTARQLG